MKIPCDGRLHHVWSDENALLALRDDVGDGAELGVNADVLYAAARKEPAIAEFCRFYSERREQEIEAGGTDDDKRKKLADAFTPRLEVTLAGLRGTLHRQLKLRVRYKFDQSPAYSSTLIVAPHAGTVLEAPSFALCGQTGKMVPEDCLQRCEMTGVNVIKHLLVRSDMSGRYALAEHTYKCSVSKQTILADEAELSAETGQVVARSYLKASEISGKLAEPELIGQCDFTQLMALSSELGVSDLSGRRYRLDEELRSIVTGKVGHRSEFIFCQATELPLAPDEGEYCQVTGYLVRPDILERCAISGMVAIPSEIQQCAASGRRALKKYFVTSSVSGAPILERFAIRSSAGKFCAPMEAQRCIWSGRKYHPDDLRTCALTGLPVHFRLVTANPHAQLQPLTELLYGVRRSEDASDLWDTIAEKASAALGGEWCRLEAAKTSLDGRHLAVCSEVRGGLGMAVRQAGLLYSFNEDKIIGRIALGKRSAGGWIDARG